MSTVSLDNRISSGKAIPWKDYAEGKQLLPFDETSPHVVEEAEDFILEPFMVFEGLRNVLWRSPFQLDTPPNKILLNKLHTLRICESVENLRKIAACTYRLFSNQPRKTSYSLYLERYIQVVVKKTIFESAIEEFQPEFAIAKLRASTSTSPWEILFGPKGILPFPVFGFMIGVSKETTFRKWLLNAELNSKEAFIALFEKEGIKKEGGKTVLLNSFFQPTHPIKHPFPSRAKTFKLLAIIKRHIHSFKTFKQSRTYTALPKPTAQTPNIIEILYRFLQENKRQLLKISEDRKAFSDQFTHEFAIEKSRIIRKINPMEPWDFLEEKNLVEIRNCEQLLQKELHPIKVKKTKRYRDLDGNPRVKTYNSWTWMQPSIVHTESFVTKNGHLTIDLDHRQVTMQSNGLIQKAHLLDMDKENGVIHFSNGSLYLLKKSTYYFMDSIGNIELAEKLSNKGIVVLRLQKITPRKPKSKSEKNQERKFSDYSSMNSWPISLQCMSQASLLPLQRQAG